MGKTRKGGSRRKRGGFAALQRLMNTTHANLKKVTQRAKEEADKAHRATMSMIDKAHAQGTIALHQAKGAAHAGLSTLQTQAAKAQGALAQGAQTVQQQAGQVTKQVGGRRHKRRSRRRTRRRTRHRTRRRVRRRKRRTHRRRRRR